MNKTNFFGYMASVVSYLEEEQRHVVPLMCTVVY